MSDRYLSFAELAAHEQEGIDYRIHVKDRRTPAVIIAPHGGRIEPGTLELSTMIADNTLSLYAFEALRTAGRRGSLHITSVRFDEPQALEIVGKAQTVVAIHGRSDDGDPETVLVGGLDSALRNKIVAGLASADFKATSVTRGRLAGRDRANICNRSANGVGVQLELPWTLRCQLKAEQERLGRFCGAVRSAVMAEGP